MIGASKKMDKNEPDQNENCHTWELFQARPMNPNPPAKIQEHLYAAPPATKPYTTQHGLVIYVPVEPNWRDD